MSFCVLVNSVIAFLLFSVVRGQEYCLTREGVRFCENSCCGPFDDQQCCSFNPTVLVLLVVAAALTILVVAILVIFCCKAKKKQRTPGVQPIAQPSAAEYTTESRDGRASSITYVVVPPGESRLFLHNASSLPPYTPEPPRYHGDTPYASGSGQVLRSGHRNSVWPMPGTSGTGNEKVASAPPSYTSDHTSISVEQDVSSKSEAPARLEHHM